MPSEGGAKKLDLELAWVRYVFLFFFKSLKLLWVQPKDELPWLQRAHLTSPLKGSKNEI